MLIRNCIAGLFLPIAVFLLAPLIASGEPSIAPDLKKAFTVEEIAWLNNHPSIRVGGVPSWAPIMMAGQDGRLSGIAGDYKRLIEAHLGITLELVDYGAAWGNVLDKAKHGEVDIVMLLGKTPERDNYLNFTDSLVDLPYVIITRADYPKVDNIADLIGKRVAVVKNFVAHEWLAGDHPEITLTPRQDTQEAMEAVALGDADAYIGDLASASYTISTLGITRLKVASQASFTNWLRIGIRKDLPMLSSIMQKTVASISQEERNRIWNSWVSLQQPGINPLIAYSIMALLMAVTIGALFIGNKRLRTAYETMEDNVLERTRELTHANESLKESESRLREAIINSPHPVMMHAEDGEVLIISKVWTEISGYTKDEIPTTGSWAEKAYGPQKETALAEMRSLYGIPEVKNEGEHPITTASGEKRIWEFTSAPLPRLADGRKAVISMAVDVTERKKSEEALKMQGEITANAAEGIALIKADTGLIIYTNRRFEIMFGYNPGELAGKHVSTINATTEKTAEATAQEIISALVERGTWEGEVLNVRKNGEVFWTQASVSSYRHHEFGELWITHQTDITARKRAEEERERFFNISLDVLCVAGADGFLKRVNPAFVRLTGLPEKEMLSRPFTEFIHPEDRDKTAEEMGRLMQGGITNNFESRYLCGDGSYKWLSWKAVGHVSARLIYATARDITERIRMEQALLESEARFRGTFEEASIGMAIVTLSGKFIRVNKELCGMLGYPESEMMTMTVDDVSHPEDMQLNKDLIKRMLAGEIPSFQMEKRYIRKDHTVVWGDLSAAYIKDEHGKPDVIIAQVRNITEHKGDQFKLKLAKEEAEEATKLKDRFVSLVAHDLKSPFTSIIGFLRLMSDDTETPLNARHREIVGHLLKSSGGMTRMIDELLNYSRLQSGHIKPESEFFDASIAAALCVENHKYMMERKGIRLVNEIPAHTRIYADWRLFGEVLDNIVSNAIKFTSPGGFIRIFTPPGSKSIVAVEDNGAGIPADFFPNIFRADVKTSTIGTGGEKGTGLGLPYSYDIMKAHGGKLSVESAAGKGTTLFAELPPVTPQVLVVDDEWTMRELICALIAPLDVNCLHAENGLMALETMRRITPHLVILDVMMPEMDGFGVITQMRQDAVLKKIPVLVISADSDIQTHENAFKLGANDFITKPLEAEELIPRARRLFERDAF